MNISRRYAVAALVTAGLLWGTTVPLSKLALEWLGPGWLTAVRFGLAAAVLLAVGRPGLRAAFTPKILASGALGYGGSVIVQNAGIARTSVTHAALLIGAVPVLVAVIAALWHHSVARPVAWAGFVVSLGGVGLITGGGGGGATLTGDGLVLISLLISATFTVAQVRLLPGRDPVAVTAVQFLAAAVAALAFTLVTEGAPAVPAGPGPVLAVGALAVFGTLVPFTLFAFGQSRVSAEVAGAFLNLEPLVGAIAGVAIFGNPLGPVQVAGGAAIVAGIGLSSLPLLAGGRAPRDKGDDDRGGDGQLTLELREGQLTPELGDGQLTPALSEGQLGQQDQRAGNWLVGDAPGPYTRDRDTPVPSGRCLYRDPVFRQPRGGRPGRRRPERGADAAARALDEPVGDDVRAGPADSRGGLLGPDLHARPGAAVRRASHPGHLPRLAGSRRPPGPGRPGGAGMRRRAGHGPAD
jgi:O-acetylserine/cysteine efflux transporter